MKALVNNLDKYLINCCLKKYFNNFRLTLFLLKQISLLHF